MSSEVALNSLKAKVSTGKVCQGLWYWSCVDPLLQCADWDAWHLFHRCIFPCLDEGILQPYLELLSLTSLHLTQQTLLPSTRSSPSGQGTTWGKLLLCCSGSGSHSQISPLSGRFPLNAVLSLAGWGSPSVFHNCYFPFHRRSYLYTCNFAFRKLGFQPSFSPWRMSGSSPHGRRINSLHFLAPCDLMNIYVFIAAWNSSGPKSTARRGNVWFVSPR